MKELRLVTKELTTNTQDDCMSVLAKLHKNFLGLKAGEHLRDTDTSLVHMSRRTEVKARTAKAQVPYRPKFPPNVV